MPDDLFPNTPFMLYLQVNNQGERVINWFEIGLFLGNESIVMRVDLALYPREEAMVPLKITLTRSGPQPGVLALDPNDKIYESEEKNNNVTVTFNVISGIDLIVSIDRPSVSNGKRALGENIDAMIKIENIGDLPAYPVTVVVRYGTSFTTYFNISTMQGNSFQQNVFPLPLFPEGTYALTASVDPFNAIPELNETNNGDLVSMRIVPRFEITGINWVDETGDAEFGPGDLLTVYVQSNLSPGTNSRIMVKENDQNGEMKGNMTLPGHESGKITIVIDHVIDDLASAKVIVVEL
jgi:subtilase family serine protease